MTHLSRLMLNPARRGTRHLLGSPQAMHAAVAAAFAPDQHPADRVLWRTDRSDHRTTLWVLSPARPDLAHVVEQAGWEESPAEVREYAPLLERLTEGQLWHFRLTANPTRVVRRPGQRGLVVPHRTPAHQLQWLLDVAPRVGVSVSSRNREPSARLVGQEVLSFRRGSSSVPLTRAVFEGALEVTDAVALRSALVSGVGRARGYGCGLLTLAPARA